MVKYKFGSVYLSFWFLVSSVLMAFHSSRHSVDPHTQTAPPPDLPVFVAYARSHHLSEHSDHNHTLQGDWSNIVEFECLDAHASSSVATHCDTCLTLSSYYLPSVDAIATYWVIVNAPDSLEQNPERLSDIAEHYLTRAPPITV